MRNNNRFHAKNQQCIKAIESTDERITGRARLALFAHYLRSIKLMGLVERKFGSIRKIKKGIAVDELFIQLLCFFMDGTSRHLCWFDHLKGDESYATLLSTKEQGLASSHAVKRFFCGFSFSVSICFVICCKDCSSGDSERVVQQ